MQSTEIRQIVVEIPIDVAPERAWQTLFDELPEWWPQDFLCFPESEKMGFEAWAGGRLYEQTADGKQILWSTLVSIVPGKSLDFVGHMTPSYGGPSLSMVRLEINPREGGGTLFRLVNSIMGRIDDEQEANLTEGWNYLFATGFKNYVERDAV